MNFEVGSSSERLPAESVSQYNTSRSVDPLAEKSMKKKKKIKLLTIERPFDKTAITTPCGNHYIPTFPAVSGLHATPKPPSECPVSFSAISADREPLDLLLLK